MYDFKQLNAFVTLSVHMHFGRAAEALGISQPALSQSIRSLEEDVGGPLINRSNRTFALTELGQSFLTDAKMILAMIEASNKNCASILSGNRAVIQVGVCPAAVSSGTFERILRETRLHFPEIRLVAVEGPPATLKIWLEEGRIDVMVSVLLGVLIPDNTVAVMMSASRPFLAARRDLGITDAAGHLLPDALSRELFILFETDIEQPHVVANLLGFEPRRILRTSSIRLLFAYVNEGYGVAIVPEIDLGMAGPDTACYPIEGERSMNIFALRLTRNTSPLLADFFRMLRDMAAS